MTAFAITTYEAASGRLRVPMTVSDWEAADLQTQVEPSLLWVVGHHDTMTHYVVDGIVVPRPALPGYDHASIEGAPAGSIVTLRNERRDVLELTYPLDPGDPLVLTDPGTYRFEIDPPFPWLPLAGEITVA